MPSDETPPRGTPRAPGRWLRSAAILAAGLVAGGVIAGTQIAGANDATSTAASAPAAAVAGAPGDAGHGPGETLLTGTTASKVEAAALDAVPGGTILRVETDAEGSPYEAHVQKSDGSVVTVKVDEDFNVTGTEPGFGAGPQPGQASATAA
jgi:hypothetical protein